MPPWKLAPALVTLRAELNAAYPQRDKASDGAIGDTAHAASSSDHNPNSEGVVCAFDVDVDLDGSDDGDGGARLADLVEHLRTSPHPDLKYVIWNRRMFSAYEARGVAPFTWRAYSGADPHTSHVHVSVGVGSDGHSAPGTYDHTDAWGVTAASIPPAPQPAPPEDDDVRVQAIFTVAKPHPDAGTFVLGHHGETACVRLLDPPHLVHWQSKVGQPITLDPMEWDELDIAEPRGHHRPTT